MNLLKPLYYLAILLSGAVPASSKKPDTNDCYKINCNAGKNSKSSSYGGIAVGNYNSKKDHQECALNGLPFTINCDSGLAVFFNFRNCITRTILPKTECPRIAKGKGYHPSSYIDIEDLPKGCTEEYKKKYNTVKNAVNDGKKGKPCR